MSFFLYSSQLWSVQILFASFSNIQIPQWPHLVTCECVLTWCSLRPTKTRAERFPLFSPCEQPVKPDNKWPWQDSGGPLGGLVRTWFTCTPTWGPPMRWRRGDTKSRIFGEFSLLAQQLKFIFDASTSGVGNFWAKRLNSSGQGLVRLAIERERELRRRWRRRRRKRRAVINVNRLRAAAFHWRDNNHGDEADWRAAVTHDPRRVKRVWHQRFFLVHRIFIWLLFTSSQTSFKSSARQSSGKRILIIICLQLYTGCIIAALAVS